MTIISSLSCVLLFLAGASEILIAQKEVIPTHRRNSEHVVWEEDSKEHVHPSESSNILSWDQQCAFDCGMADLTSKKGKALSGHSKKESRWKLISKAEAEMHSEFTTIFAPLNSPLTGSITPTIPPISFVTSSMPWDEELSTDVESIADLRGAPFILIVGSRYLLFSGRNLGEAGLICSHNRVVCVFLVGSGIVETGCDQPVTDTYCTQCAQKLCAISKSEVLSTQEMSLIVRRLHQFLEELPQKSSISYRKMAEFFKTRKSDVPVREYSIEYALDHSHGDHIAAMVISATAGKRLGATIHGWNCGTQ